MDELNSLDDLIDARSAMIALQKSPGWAILVAIFQNDLLAKENLFSGPVKSDAEIYAQEYCKGAVAQIKTAIGLPKQLIDNWNVEIETHSANKEKSDDTRREQFEPIPDLDGTDAERAP